MSQANLGMLLKVGKGAVSAWEVGRNRIDVETYAKICKILDMPFKELQDMEIVVPDEELITSINFLKERPELNELIDKSKNLSKEKIIALQEIISKFQE